MTRGIRTVMVWCAKEPGSDVMIGGGMVKPSSGGRPRWASRTLDDRMPVRLEERSDLLERRQAVPAADGGRCSCGPAPSEHRNVSVLQPPHPPRPGTAVIVHDR